MPARERRATPGVALALASILLGSACTGDQPRGSPIGRESGPRSPASGAAATVPSAVGAGRGLPVGGFAEVVVAGLRLRGGAGTAAPVIGGRELTLGELVYVAEAPVTAEGVPWYHVQLEDAFGWVAGGTDTDRYLAPVEPPCRSTPTSVADVEGGHPAVRLVCFGRDDLDLRGWIPETSTAGVDCFCTASPEWLADPFAYQVVESEEVAAWRGDPYGIKYRIDPSGAVTVPPSNEWVDLTGHFDDPAAVTCTLTPTAGTSGVGFDAVQVVVSCREQFVVTGWQPEAAR
ncbi:MAG: hypothetical protein ABR509_00370 [Candidatus Limnocylindria bacterium]